MTIESTSVLKKLAPILVFSFSSMAVFFSLQTHKETFIDSMLNKESEIRYNIPVTSEGIKLKEGIDEDLKMQNSIHFAQPPERNFKSTATLLKTSPSFTPDMYKAIRQPTGNITVDNLKVQIEELEVDLSEAHQMIRSLVEENNKNHHKIVEATVLKEEVAMYKENPLANLNVYMQLILTTLIGSVITQVWQFLFNIPARYIAYMENKGKNERKSIFDQSRMS